MNLTDPVGLTQIPHSNLFIKTILILKSDFGQIHDQSKFWIISPNWVANENSRIDKAIEVRSEIIRTR